MTSSPDKTICSKCRLEYDGDALFCPNCGTAKSRPSDGDTLVGATVGDRYLLIERIGQGASGTIYRAEHVTLRRRVAVKVLHHELSRDDLAIERFRREATTVGEIDNDHIVEIYDFGRTGDGRLYLAMEYLEGHTLAELLEREGRLPVDRAVDILIQLGEALIEAHAMGYVHRDLRPRNIYLAARRGKPNYIKLLDFGLAKLVEKEGEAASTSLGMTFGDPHYMSPEAARGDPIDRRSDIYSLGCIAYEMLVGEPPFVGDKAFEVLTQQVEAPAPEPAAMRSDVPAWLNRALLRCLSKSADERFITVFRLVEALRQGEDSGFIMSDEVARRPETTPPPSVSRAMEKLEARRSAEEEVPAGVGGQTSLGLGFSGDDVRRTLEEVGMAAGGAPSHAVDDDPTAPAPSPPYPPPAGADPGGGAGAGEEDEDDVRATAVRPPREVRASSSASGKARRDPGSSAGISAAWYADGDALETDGELDPETRRKLDRARGRTPSRTGMLAAADDDYYDPPHGGRWKLAAGGAGGVVVLLALVLLLWPGGDPSGGEAEAPPEESDSALVAAGAPADTVDADAAVVPEALAESDAAVAVAEAEVDAGGTVVETPPDPPVKVVAADPPPVPVLNRDRDRDRDREREAERKQREAERRQREADERKQREAERRQREAEQRNRDRDRDTAAAGPGASDEDKKRAQFFANLGASELRNNNVIGAATNFKKALDLDPQSGRARTGLGEIALSQGSYDAAVSHLRQAARLQPGNSRVHTLLGEALLGAGQRSQATESFKRALQLDPDNARARNGFHEASGS